MAAYALVAAHVLILISVFMLYLTSRNLLALYRQMRMLLAEVAPTPAEAGEAGHA
ncbi:MAG: hypothetical protein V4757_07320 [Pseudomonadota bacterium]